MLSPAALQREVNASPLMKDASLTKGPEEEMDRGEKPAEGGVGWIFFKLHP